MKQTVDRRQDGTMCHADVRKIVSLVSGASLGDGSLSAKRKVLLEGVRQLTGADAWIWVQSGRNYLGDLPAFAISQKGGFSVKQFERYLAEYLGMRELCAPILEEVIREKRHVTRLRREVSPKWLDEESGDFEAWKTVDLGPMILSFRPLDSGNLMSGIVLFRRFDRELFTEQDCETVHMILSEVAWLHRDATLSQLRPAAFDVSPRLNEVLNLLLQGLARKQIAARLGITINTVGGYIKDLYQRFEVHSQPELIKRFVDGD